VSNCAIALVATFPDAARVGPAITIPPSPPCLAGPYSGRDRGRLRPFSFPGLTKRRTAESCAAPRRPYRRVGRLRCGASRGQAALTPPCKEERTPGPASCCDGCHEKALYRWTRNGPGLRCALPPGRIRQRSGFAALTGRLTVARPASPVTRAGSTSVPAGTMDGNSSGDPITAIETGTVEPPIAAIRRVRTHNLGRHPLADWETVGG
jgi:hypothetical protein